VSYSQKLIFKLLKVNQAAQRIQVTPAWEYPNRAILEYDTATPEITRLNSRAVE
jgi:hypothetical protein